MGKDPTAPRKPHGQRPRRITEAPAVPVGPWAGRAACTTADPETFFPVGNEPNAAAKQYCARCPVCDSCRDYALAAGEEFGVWGGLNEAERKAILASARQEQTAWLSGGAA
jgi:WhiB family transcriptional regulator, redox-sensing transcriptional regulator